MPFPSHRVGIAPIYPNAHLLGKSIVLLPNGNDAFDLGALTQNMSIIVRPNTETADITFPGGMVYSIPTNMDVTAGVGGTVTNSLRVETGSDLADDLDIHAKLNASYMGVTAEASAQYSYHSTLSSSQLYAIVSIDHESFNLTLHGHDEVYNNVDQSFLTAARKLPNWDLGDPDAFDQYWKFFRSWGTHVVKSCTFGGRYQLRVKHGMIKGETKQSFAANMRAEYNGVANISGEVGIKGSDEYKSYRDTRSTLACVRGGTPGDSIILSSAPDDPDKYTKALADWAKGLNDPNTAQALNFSVDSIGNLLNGSSDPTLQNVSTQLTNALDYISSLRCVSGSITCNAYGVIPNPTYHCKLDDIPGMKLELIGQPSGNLTPIQDGLTGLRLKLDNSSEIQTLGSATGEVPVLVTTPQQPSFVNIDKPDAQGYFGFSLDLSPGGATVQSTTEDRDPGHTRQIEVSGSLCRPRTYGK